MEENTITLLQAKIKEVIAKNEAAGLVTDVTVLNLVAGSEVISYNDSTEQFAASVNKAPVANLLLIDLRAGSITMSQTLSWNADLQLAGTGYYDQPGAPLTGSLQDVFFDMLNRSGNTAVNVFVQLVLGGPVKVNERFKQELDLTQTYLQPLDDNNFYLGNTVSREAVGTMQRLCSGDDQYQQFVTNALATDIFTTYGVRSQLPADSPLKLVNKVGYLNDPSGNNRHDAGLLFDTNGTPIFAYAILTTAQGEEYCYPTAQGGVALAYIGKAMLDAIS